MAQNTLPQTPALDFMGAATFVRQSQLVSKRGSAGPLGFSSATLWRWVKAGLFPQPVKLAAGVTAWRVADVRAWIEAKGGTQ